MKNIKTPGIFAIAIALFACNKADESVATPLQPQKENSNEPAGNAQQTQLTVSTKSGAASYIVAFKTEYPYSDGRKLTLQEAEAVGLEGVEKGLAEMKGALGANLGDVETVSPNEAKVKATLTSDEVSTVRALSRVVWLVEEIVVAPESEKIGGIENVPGYVVSTEEKTSIMPLPDIKLDSQSAACAPQSPSP